MQAEADGNGVLEEGGTPGALLADPGLEGGNALAELTGGLGLGLSGGCGVGGIPGPLVIVEIAVLSLPKGPVTVLVTITGGGCPGLLGLRITDDGGPLVGVEGLAGGSGIGGGKGELGTGGALARDVIIVVGLGPASEVPRGVFTGDETTGGDPGNEGALDGGSGAGPGPSGGVVVTPIAVERRLLN